MKPEDSSEQEVPGPESPDGIIEIEYYDVTPVSSQEVVDSVPDGIIEAESLDIPIVAETVDSVDDVAYGVIETESYDAPIATEMVDVQVSEESEIAYNPETVTEDPVAFTAESVSPDTIETAINPTDTMVENEDTLSNPDNVADIPVTPVSNITNEASSMANQSPTTPHPSSNENFDDWVVMPESAWPQPIFMKKNVNPKERFYLEYRWYSQWSFYDSKATQNKNTYFYLQRWVVIGSLIIPALISLNSAIARFITEFIPTTQASAAETENIVRIGVDAITVVLSLSVAGAAAMESLYKYGENWSSYRSAAEELQAEKNFYDMSAGPYAISPNPFATFVERVEGIVANQNGKYFQAVQAQIAKQTEDNEDIVDDFLSGDDDGDDDVAVTQSTALP